MCVLQIGCKVFDRQTKNAQIDDIRLKIKCRQLKRFFNNSPI